MTGMPLVRGSKDVPGTRRLRRKIWYWTNIRQMREKSRHVNGLPSSVRAAIDSNRAMRRKLIVDNTFASRSAHHRIYGESMKITVSTLVEAPLPEVWRAYTTPDDIKAWNAASSDWHTTSASVDLRAGGKFSSRMEAKDGSFGFDFAGEYTNIVQYELIEYTFGERVAVVHFVEHPSGVKVTVNFDGESSHSEEQQRTGWQAILDNFARHVKGKLASV